MAFDVIPAVDISKGRLARFDGNAALPVEAFGGDPMAAAKSFVDDGAAWIHVVDIDKALGGEFAIADSLSDISAMPVRVQTSGGLVRAADLTSALACGASRAVLGSAALGDQGRVEELIGEFGPRLVVAIETNGKEIVPRGTSAAFPLDETLAWLAGAGAARYLYVRVPEGSAATEFDRDGIAALMDATGGPVIASGGIIGLEQLQAAASIEGVEAAIIGRAFAEGSMTLADAIRETR